LCLPNFINGMNFLPDHCDPKAKQGIILFSRDANPIVPVPPFAFISLTKYLVGAGYYIKCGCSFYVSFYHFVHLVIASLKHISNFLVHQNYPI
jgi:hypothetical protein